MRKHRLRRGGRWSWLTRGVLAIGLASLFSDLGHVITTALLPAFVVVTLGAPALALGLSREAWIRDQLSSLAVTPVIKLRYALYFSEKTDIHEAIGRIVRNPDTPEGVHTLLFNPTDLQKQVFDQALALVTRNGPADREQAAIFLHAVEGDSLDAFYALAINTGMRRGEILALHWADVDLDNGTAQVRYTLQDDKGGHFTFAPPKTEQSARSVPLNQTALAALRRHRAQQAQQRLRMGAAWQDSRGLVFTTLLGAPMRGNHILQRHFEPLCRSLGLPRVRLHDLRHTAASLWFDQGYQDEVISKLLGHSSPTVTSTIYIHVTRDKQREAAEALDRLFSRS